MNKVIYVMSFGLAFMVFGTVFSLVLAWPFMWMWNYAAVAALSIAQPINYWPAFWLMILVSLFFVGSRTSSSPSS